MQTDLDVAKQLLKDGAAIAVVRNGERFVSDEKMIFRLLQLCGDGLLKGASVADKIVGKAAALLLIKGGAASVYGEVASESAAEVFSRYPVDFSYGTLTPYIVNRRGNGKCPMELTVEDIDDPDEAFEALKTKAARLSGK